MTTQRKMEANRRNAQKSTGPRTEEGKAKVKFNALKHGMTAETVVLPHEDAAAYEQRLETWTRELNPPGKLGHYLAERVVRISWQLDRADFHERDRLANRLRKAPADRDRARLMAVTVLMNRLFDAGRSARGDRPSQGPGREATRAWPMRLSGSRPRPRVAGDCSRNGPPSRRSWTARSTLIRRPRSPWPTWGSLARDGPSGCSG